MRKPPSSLRIFAILSENPDYQDAEIDLPALSLTLQRLAARDAELPRSDPLRLLTAVQLGQDLEGLSDDMVRLREKDGALFSVLPVGRLRGRLYRGATRSPTVRELLAKPRANTERGGERTRRLRRRWSLSGVAGRLRRITALRLRQRPPTLRHLPRRRGAQRLPRSVNTFRLGSRRMSPSANGRLTQP